MRNKWEDIQAEITHRIWVEFDRKFKGNKAKFAREAGCDEKTIRKLFDEGMNMKLELLFKLCDALEIEPSDVLKEIKNRKIKS